MPTLVDVSERIASWLYTRLSGDATLITLVGIREYRELAPQGAAYPMITYFPQSDVAKNGVSGQYIMSSQLWLVKITSQGESYASIRPISDRVLQVLQEAGQVAVNGAFVGKAVFQQTIPQGSEYIGSVRHNYKNLQFKIEGHPL